MRRRANIDLEEYEWLSLARDGSFPSAADFARVAAAWEAMTGRKAAGAFEFGAGRVRPTNWTGTMSAAGIELHVSPRGANRLASDERAALDTAIGEMLEFVLAQKTHVTSESASAPDSGRLERAIEAFCEIVLSARRVRVLRGYRASEGNTRAARGTVRFPDQALLAVTRPGLVASRWVELDEDLPENRFLKAVLILMRPRCAGRLRRRLDDALVALENVSPSADAKRDYALIRFERLPREYVDAIHLGRDLLDGRALGLFAGAIGTRSEVVFMDSLFQAFIGRLTSAAARRWGLFHSGERPGRYLGRWIAGPSVGRSAVELLPDAELSLDASGVPVLLIDAKWKVLDPARRGFGITAGDIHQMLAYSQRLRCQRAALVYPWVGVQPPFEDQPVLLVGNRDAPLELHVLTVRLPWASLQAAQSDFEADLEPLLSGLI